MASLHKVRRLILQIRQIIEKSVEQIDGIEKMIRSLESLGSSFFWETASRRRAPSLSFRCCWRLSSN